MDENCEMRSGRSPRRPSLAQYESPFDTATERTTDALSRSEVARPQSVPRPRVRVHPTVSLSGVGGPSIAQAIFRPRGIRAEVSYFLEASSGDFSIQTPRVHARHEGS